MDNREQMISELAAKLAEAEHAGPGPVMEIAEGAMEEWKEDWEKLAVLMHSLFKRAEETAGRNRVHLTALYFKLMHKTQDEYAEKYLSEKDRELFGRKGIEDLMDDT